MTAKNFPFIGEIPKDIKWLALHIYGDETVEIKLSEGTVDELQTERGQKIIEVAESGSGR